ncbi:MAG: hypothetical protein JKY14_13855, partial [Paraglaciecola sp.]|nr:hypothetical protein [Paraglaciecola sp.]
LSEAKNQRYIGVFLILKIPSLAGNMALGRNSQAVPAQTPYKARRGH